MDQAQELLEGYQWDDEGLNVPQENPPAAPVTSVIPTEGAIPQENLALSAAGAAVGAGSGALVWFAVAYVFGIEIGILAAFVGALAGWGAVWIGKTRSNTVGVIAAVAGLVGIFFGSYTGYYNGSHTDIERAQFRQEFYYAQRIENPAFEYMSDQEKEAHFENTYQQHMNSQPGYFASLTSDPLDVMIVLLFEALGLYCGFRVGSGRADIISSVWK